MPGRGEGFGFVFLEALACGIPVVGSTLDGSREALRQGSLGILVNPNCPEDIRAGILEALKRPRGIIPAGLEYFSFENFQKRCHDILRQVVKTRGGG
jgi:glycosyltransferase involved in cell wall biosynthesis